MIRLHGIEKVYRTDRIETVALADVNMEVAQGEFISVMGPSGCGKSTLLNLIGLLDAPTRGTVQINGSPIATYRDRALAAVRNKEIGFVFQTFHLIGDLSVLDNVQVPLLYRRMSNAERRRLALAALDRVGRSARVHHFPSQLSGGQQQRVAIARAIVGRPRILLADEPTGNLDSQMARSVLELLEEINGRGTTILMVTHDPELAARASRNVHIIDGQVSDLVHEPVLRSTPAAPAIANP